MYWRNIVKIPGYKKTGPQTDKSNPQLDKKHSLHDRIPDWLKNSPLGQLCLDWNETTLMFEPDRQCPASDPSVVLKRPEKIGLEGFGKLGLHEPREPQPARAGDVFGGLTSLTAGKEIYGAFYKQAAPGCPTLAYCHGSAYGLEVRAPVLKAMAKCGLGIMIAAYPGFKGSEQDADGNAQLPSMAGCHRAAEAMRRKLEDDFHIPGHMIVPFGESMGGEVAADQAVRMEERGSPAGGLILLNPFRSMGDWITQHYSRLNPERIENKFDTAGALRKLEKTPALIMASKKDEVTSYHNAELLATEGNNVTPELMENANHRLIDENGHPDPAQIEEAVRLACRFLAAHYPALLAHVHPDGTAREAQAAPVREHAGTAYGRNGAAAHMPLKWESRAARERGIDLSPGTSL